MGKSMGGVLRITAAAAILTALAACAAPGPSMKERAEEAAQRKKANKENEEFAKSLPPTDAKPIFKP
jgi:ribosomal protein L12E/L44/L45/RPP1/RPP2